MRQVIETDPFEDVALSGEDARGLYRDMVRARRFDERAISLQRQGWMSSYPPYTGQEASQVGTAHALDAEDWLFPTYRSNGLQIARGVPMSDILLFRRGRTEYHSDHDLPIFPQAVPIATQLPHAVGAGMAVNYTDAEHAICCYFGDGATSEGDFHEAMNFAGVFETPVVFLCENNGWAISLPAQKQTASATIAQKAQAYGFDGVRVDGNDPIAVQQTVAEAIETAKTDEPVLVESLTYRQGAHSTSDDPSRYEDRQASLPDWRMEDPLDRFQSYLLEHGVLDDDRIETIEDEVEAELDEAVDIAEASPRPDHDEVFSRVYEQESGRMANQRAWLDAHVETHGHPEFEY
jgi:pyruvate dehydrogenase E1 component alpha subunit